MGQQQLLLIILGVIVVGIAVAVGITMFTDNAVSANRDAVINDLVNLASRAQQYYRRPAALGGGQGAFDASNGGGGISLITQLTSKPLNANGSYVISTAASATSIGLTGYGTEKGTDGNPIQVIMTVFADSTFCAPQN
jgi:Tfp pilus assembly protein PilE